jgi:hypothetical protein
MEWQPNFYYGKIPADVTIETLKPILAAGLCKEMIEYQEFINTCKEMEKNGTLELVNNLYYKYEFISYHIFKDDETYERHFINVLDDWFEHDKIDGPGEFYHLVEDEVCFREFSKEVFDLAMEMKDGPPVLK